MTKIEIAEAFSHGKFDKIIEFITDEATWEVVEESKFVGKKAIIENCNQVSTYFKSVETDFKTLNIITQDNKVVVMGTAKFLRNNKQISFVSACDIYEFTDNNKILKITSYCIQANEA